MSRPNERTAPEAVPGRSKSVVATHPQDTGITRASATDRLRHCYAVVVAGKTIRKHLYFNLPAAQRAVTRAEARGAVAHMILVQLVPVDAHEHDTLEAVTGDAE